MKKEIDQINAVPSKRLFLSIIADYDLNRSICELVDNAIDHWTRSGKKGKLNISIEPELSQQTITISDNGGGIIRDEIPYIVGPGQTSNKPQDEIIGIFGVGSKRAVVALSQEIKITTRHKRNKTYRIEFDDKWLESESWLLPLYEFDEIAIGTTIIELQKLRMHIDDEAIGFLKVYLSETYALFLKKQDVTISVGSEIIRAKTFENWAYPPKYPPLAYSGKIKTEESKDVSVKVKAGLSLESSPASGEYGVYFYCNNRLIAKNLKSHEVGFGRGLAGVPHPNMSLTRVIVNFTGEAISMPWNSSKSNINPNHAVFLALREWLMRVVKDFTSLSRRWEGSWHTEVFKHKKGAFKSITIPDFHSAKKSFLPPLPISRPRYVDKVVQANKSTVKTKPWTKGLYESIVAVDYIMGQRLEQKGRIALILLDSNLEIAFKEYLVNDSGGQYSNRKLLDLFQTRHNVESEIKKYINLSDDDWRKIKHYYDLRNKLVHERATVGINDTQVNDYRKLVQRVLNKLFKLKF